MTSDVAGRIGGAPAARELLINGQLPRFDARSFSALVVDATPEATYRAVRSLDPGQVGQTVPFLQLMGWMRALPARIGSRHRRASSAAGRCHPSSRRRCHPSSRRRCHPSSRRPVIRPAGGAVIRPAGGAVIRQPEALSSDQPEALSSGQYRDAFLALAEEPGVEFVIGVIGKFSAPTELEFRRFRPAEFAGFAEPGSGKVAISFLVLPYGASRSLLCTDTRTAITGAETARRFRRYWTAIGPFAAYIMRHWLALAKQNAERDGALTAEQTEQVRTRVRLLIDITARAGAYRKGLLAAAGQLSPEEAAIIVDLARHGMQVPQLHDVLCGGHVLIDDPQLYENWRFEKVSHLRVSSHHRDIDKTRYPDIGMRGQVVREKLHGRTAHGTWVQLEKTPAAFGKRKLPSPDDVRHLVDYVIYRVTRSNVGPWGLSRLTERRPIYLSPDLAVPAPLTPAVASSLASALRRIEADDDMTAASQDLAARFPPPERADPAGELGRALSGRAGRGLFGNSDVWVTETPSRVAAAILGRDGGQPPAGTLWTEAGLL